ncbi:MAG: hypothetical protein LBJ23_05330, partial [Tannerella sp.]|nr:hypothetical protein [Tannerella sp.]
ALKAGFAGRESAFWRRSVTRRSGFRINPRHFSDPANPKCARFKLSHVRKIFFVSSNLSNIFAPIIFI